MCSALVALAGASAFAATVYKWVDENGVIHYSDQPHPNAKEMDVKGAQTYESAGAPRVSSSAPTTSTEPGAVYRLCEIARPENDEVFLNTDTVSTRVRLDPAQLRGGDRIAIGLDGKRVQTSGSSDATLKVERGTHSLVAVIEDSEGKAVCTSATVTFHVRQPSVQAPNPANRPRF